MQIKILMVEDDPVFGTFLAFQLKKHYEVKFCAHMTEALGIIHDDPHQFQLVLTDYDNPVLGGGALICQAMCKHAPEVPLIVMTGGTGDIESLRQSCNADEYLLKPFTFAELNGVIKKLLKIS